MPDPSAKHPIVRWLRWALGGFVALGVGVAFWRLVQRWDGREVQLRWQPILVSLVVLRIANVFQALGWLRRLERMSGKTLGIRPVLTVFMLSQMARYAPGKVGVPMVRIAASTRMGVQPQTVAASVGIEVGSWMGLGAIMGCVALLCSNDTGPNWLQVNRVWLWLGLATLLTGIGVALLVDRNRFPPFILRMIRAEGHGPMVTLQMVWMQLISWGGWWLLGVLMPLSVGASLSVAMRHASIFILAPILGFLAVVAPGGLGVREAVISYALAPSLGASAALAAALLARGVAMASELIGWLLALYWERSAQK